MDSIILHRRTTTESKVPLLSTMYLGEIVINTTDGKVFIKKESEGNESLIDLIHYIMEI